MIFVMPELRAARYLVFSASLRRDSLNSLLASLAARTIVALGGEVDLASMRDFDAPSYDADVQDDEGFPPGAKELRCRLESCDAFVISSPEYNASDPDCSRTRSTGSPATARSPSTSDTGCSCPHRPRWWGAIAAYGRCASHSSISARGCTRTCSRSRRRTTRLPMTAGSQRAAPWRFENNIANFMDLVEAAKHYPCVKRAWVEHLGELPDPVIDRVESRTDA
jgi:chromate reductase, NAD(P)H dehydrogenase (quinone)